MRSVLCVFNGKTTNENWKFSCTYSRRSGCKISYKSRTYYNEVSNERTWFSHYENQLVSGIFTIKSTMLLQIYYIGNRFVGCHEQYLFQDIVAKLLSLGDGGVNLLRNMIRFTRGGVTYFNKIALYLNLHILIKLILSSVVSRILLVCGYHKEYNTKNNVNLFS